MENTEFPQGWYRFDLSKKIKPGKIYSYHYFDKPLVCFRDKKNMIHIFDAHCPHLGAHLGVGGIIQNDRIICPFHGWQYNAQGKCVEIPYCKTIPKRAQLNRYESLEMNSVIYIKMGNQLLYFPFNKIFLTNLFKIETTDSHFEQWMQKSKLYHFNFENFPPAFFIEKNHHIFISRTPIDNEKIILDFSCWYNKDFTLLNIFSTKRNAYKKIGKLMCELPVSVHSFS